MTVSIIIAVKTWGGNLEECVGKCLELDFSDFEILILPDEPVSEDLLQPLASKSKVVINVIPTGAVKPSEKRDIALKYAKGDILAFIDDDAFPVKDWLKNAKESFQDKDVAAVGGPAITAEGDNSNQKASGLVYSSALVSGKYVYRYVPKKKLEVDDFPTCNLLVRKSVMEELGGFKTIFWPGEDTKLCLEITKKLGKKIIYDPSVLVYHHRRPLFLPHIRQVASYALHRGYFVKIYPLTSLKAAYFVPSLFLLCLLTGGFLSLLLSSLRTVYLAAVYLYLLLIFASTLHYKNPRLIQKVFLGIISTHIAYGIYFLKGLLLKRLPEEKYKI